MEAKAGRGLISENSLFDSLTALGLFIGVAPAVGSVILAYIFVKALFNFSDPANSYTGQERLGAAPPAVIGVGMPLLGVILPFGWRLRKREPFFKLRPEVADPELLAPKPAPAVSGGAA